LSAVLVSADHITWHSCVKVGYRDQYRTVFYHRRILRRMFIFMRRYEVYSHQLELISLSCTVLCSIGYNSIRGARDKIATIACLLHTTENIIIVYIQYL